MEVYFTTTELIKIDLLWKIGVLLGMCTILSQVIKSNKIGSTNLSRTVLDDGPFLRLKPQTLEYQ